MVQLYQRFPHYHSVPPPPSVLFHGLTKGGVSNQDTVESKLLWMCNLSARRWSTSCVHHNFGIVDHFCAEKSSAWKIGREGFWRQVGLQIRFVSQQFWWLEMKGALGLRWFFCDISDVLILRSYPTDSARWFSYSQSPSASLQSSECTRCRWASTVWLGHWTWSSVAVVPSHILNLYLQKSCFYIRQADLRWQKLWLLSANSALIIIK